MTEANVRTEVVVIGGGPAGAATALTLARRGVSVLVLERGDGSGSRVGECLAPSAMTLLHRLGVYDAVLATRPLPSHANRSSWGGDGSLAEHSFLHDPYGPGWHLDRPAFNAALLAAAEGAGAVCRRHAMVRRAERGPGGRWLLHVEDRMGQHRVAADLVVDAGGRRAGFAARQGARRLAVDRLVAVAATLQPAATPLRDSTTLVEAAENGWWYSALLADGRLAAIFFSDPDLLAATGAWRRDAWFALLGASRHTRARTAEHGYELVAAPRVVAASSSCLTPIAGDRWLAAGDAAATYDPLSSHGIASALAAGYRAAAAVADYLGGDARALGAYAEGIVRGYVRYLWMWQAYYAEERRWPSAPFWRRRQEWRQPSERPADGEPGTDVSVHAVPPGLTPVVALNPSQCEAR